MSAMKIASTVAAIVVGCAFGVASAKLPAPTEEQKAKTAEARAKAGETTKRQAELLGKAQDRAAENHKRGRVQKTGAVRP